MATSFDAVYENGVFKPLEPVDLVNGLRVHITLSAPEGPLTKEQIQGMLRLGQRAYEGLTEENIQEIEASFERPHGAATPKEGEQ